MSQMGVSVKQISAGGGRAFSASSGNRFRSPIDKAKAYEVVWNQVSGLFDAARPYANASFVYVIGETDDYGPIKIGLSKDPISRLRGMQTGNPRRLRIEYVLFGDMRLEKLLHELWEPFAVMSARATGRVNAAPGTEWFKADARNTLLPIIEDAVNRQIELLEDPETMGFDDMEAVVRAAHADSGFTARGRDSVRVAGPLGTGLQRPSRI